MAEYLNPVCRGSFMLGTACGRCERCNEQKAQYAATKRVEAALHNPQPANVPYDLFREACERLADIIEGDDGEAYFEGEKFLKRNAPDLYNVIGASLREDVEPLPDFPEPTLIDKASAVIVGLLIRKPKKMITPDIMAKTGSEHGIQAGLFAWVAVAKIHGFEIANAWGENRLFPPFAGGGAKGVAALHWFHAIPNGGSRGDDARSRAIRGATMKAEGVRDGVADCFLPVPMFPYHGLYIEMKTPTGAIRPAQREFRNFALANGYAFSFERSWRDAAKLIELYLKNTNQPINLKEK